MTTEEKAKAYDEAIKKAREIKEKIVHSHLSTENCKAVSEYIDTIIPELVESDDEKIRKAIVLGIKKCEYAGSIFGTIINNEGVKYHEVLAYLEKQKEQNGKNEKDSDFIIYHPLKNGKGEYECIPYSFYGSLTSFSEDKDLIDFLRTCFYTEEECNEWIEQQKEEEGYEAIPVESTLEYKLGFKAGKESEKQKEQKDYKKLYEDIAKSEWFKKSYEGKSLGCDNEQGTEEYEYDKETITQKAYREGQNAGRQEVFDNPGAYGLENINNVFGFRIGDKVRLKDGDGRPHIIKYFEKIEGLHGPDFYRVIFEDNTASDHIIPGDEYLNGYYTHMEKIDGQKGQKPEHFELKAEKWYICHHAYCCRADHLTVKEGERFMCEKDGIVKGFVIKEPEKYFKECSAPVPMEDEQKEQKSTSYSPLCNTIKDKIREYVANHFVTDAVVKTDVRSIVKAMEEGVRLGKEEQEPAEWSEEDIEKMVNARARKSGTTKSEMCFYRQGIEDTLKSFRLQQKVDGCISPEEGDIVVNKYGEISVFNYWGHHPDGGSFNDKTYFFAKCTLKEGDFDDDCCTDAYGLRYATPEEIRTIVPYLLSSPRPSWKPSDEQMQCLLAVITNQYNAGAESCHLTLGSLYNDLKKLM